LRICTPLLALLPPLRRIWNFSSKSPYFFLLHRKVLKDSPLGSGVLPTMAPSLACQYSVSPSQPSRSLPLKKPREPSPPRAARPQGPGARARPSTMARGRMVSADQTGGPRGYGPRAPGVVNQAVGYGRLGPGPFAAAAGSSAGASGRPAGRPAGGSGGAAA